MSKELELSVSPEFKPIIEKVSEIVHKISGNKFGEKQSFMVESRIKKRMMELSIKSPDDYIKYIESNKAEINMLVSLMTTHHTFFFREFAHFDLLKNLLPKVVAACKQRGEKTVHIWSAACSRGHEVYSLAMFMEVILPTIDPTMNYKILGTDIDSESIRIATNGVYHHNELKEIPMSFLGEHWAKGSGEILLYSKVKKSLRDKCDFREGNLLQVKESSRSQKFDIIFCRNVFIYFEPYQIEAIAEELLKTLHPEGVFFSGISESLMGYKLEVSSVGPSVYIHSGNTNPSAREVMPAPKSTDAVVFQIQKYCRVLCVDDSPSIITMLKKILSKEHGFEVVATASNGVEAAEILKTMQIDLMTLDIHMPQMDGVAYLKKYYKKDHPAVVMVSSVDREDTELAIQALKAGASDYVEKPSLVTLEERGDELRNKFRALALVAPKNKLLSSMDKDFQIKISIESAETKIRLMVAAIADISKITTFFNEAACIQPPTLVLLEGYGEMLEAFVKENKYKFKQKVHYLKDGTQKLETDNIYFCDSRKMMKVLQKEHSMKPASVLCYGIVSRWTSQELLVWKTSHIVLEDYGHTENIKHPLYGRSGYIAPATSFYYLSLQYLSKK